MGRTHDGYCIIHGENSAKLYHSEIKQIISDEYLQKQVLEAVKYHSILDEYCPKEVQNNIIFKVLKDADALDRGRLRETCDKSFLRLDVFETETGDRIVEFMHSLAYHTECFKWENPYKELTDCIQLQMLNRL